MNGIRTIAALGLMVMLLILGSAVCGEDKPATQPASSPADTGEQQATSASTQPIRYNGHDVTDAWIRAQHKYFADKIVKVGDDYIDIGSKIAESAKKWGGAKVSFDHLPPGLKFYRASGSDGLWFASEIGVHGPHYKVHRDIPGAGDGYLVCIADTDAKTKIAPNALSFYVQEDGKEQVKFTDQSGHLYVLPRLRRVMPLTLDEFRQAIQTGFMLIRYKQITVHHNNTKPGPFFGIRTYDTVEIKETPVK